MTDPVTLAAIITAVKKVVIQIIISVIVNKIFGPKGGNSGQDVGVTQRLRANTGNKVGVGYGNFWVKGTDLWGQSTPDQKTGYYVIGLTLNPRDGTVPNTLNQVYWQEYRLLLDGLGNVTAAYDQAGNYVEDFNNKIRVQFFSNGIDSIRNQIDVNDTTAFIRDPNNKYTGYTGVVITVKLDIKKQIYRLEDMTFNVSNTLNQPGAVIQDYLASKRYGCGLSADKIGSGSLNALSSYAAQLLQVQYNGMPVTQARYEINGVLNPTQDTWTNFEALTQSAGSLPLIDASTGTYGVYIDRPGASAYSFTTDDILGSIRVDTAALNDTPNQIEATYPRGRIIDSDTRQYAPDLSFKGQQDNIFRELPDALIPKNAPINKVSATYYFSDNPIQSTRLCTLNLNQSSLDLTTTFSTNHLSYGITAGEVVDITYAPNGWYQKLFRVMRVDEKESQDGSIVLEYTCKEYADAIYTDVTVVDANPALNVNWPSVRAQANFTPSTPTIINVNAAAAIPSFTINMVNSPASQGLMFSTEYIEIYYGTSANPDSDMLLTTVTPSGDTFADGQTIQYAVTQLAAGTYYFRTRYYASQLASNFSARSMPIVWNPQPVAQVTGEALNPTFNPNVILVPSNAQGVPTTLNQVATLTLFSGAEQVPYSTAVNDAGMPNNSWRITGSSTTAGLTVTGPTASGSYAATYTVGNLSQLNSTLSVALRYKDITGTTYDAGTAVIQINQQRSGNNASSALITGLTSFRRSSSGTYTPANATFGVQLVNVTNPRYSWSVTGGTPTSSNNSSITVTPNAGVSTVSVSLSVTGDNTGALNDTRVCSIVDDGAPGQVGDAGNSYASPTIYRWLPQNTPPSLSGTSTYNWSNGTLSNVPSGWSASDPGNQIQGYYRWQATAPINTSNPSGTTSINWGTRPVIATAYNGEAGGEGPEGPPGPQGANGAAGANGSGSYYIDRGSINDNSAPTNTEVNNNAGRTDGPRNGDVAMISYNNYNGYITYRYIAGRWQLAVLQIPGNVIVQGSLSVDRLVSAMSLAATQYLQVGNPTINFNNNTISSGSGARLNGNGTGAIGSTTSSIIFGSGGIVLNGPVVATGNIQSGAVTQVVNGSFNGSAGSGWTTLATIGLPSTGPSILVVSGSATPAVYGDNEISPVTVRVLDNVGNVVGEQQVPAMSGNAAAFSVPASSGGATSYRIQASVFTSFGTGAASGSWVALQFKR